MNACGKVAVLCLVGGLFAGGCGQQGSGARNSDQAPEAESPSGSNGGVVAQVKKAIDDKLLHQDGSCYGYEAYAFDNVPTALIEMKDPTIKVWPDQLDEGDKANGIEWRGSIGIECKVWRRIPVSIDRQTKEVTGVDGKWSDWHDGSKKGDFSGFVDRPPVLPTRVMMPPHQIVLTIRKGEWQWTVKDAPKPTPGIVRMASE